MTLTCLVPAWNEAPRLPRVLTALSGHPLIDRLLVIDDGSTDGTADAALAMGAEVLRLPTNGGKTAALAAGIATLAPGQALLIDADLQGLTAEDVTRLVHPVLSGQVAASLSLRGNAPALWRWLGVDYLSGERVLPVALLREALPALPHLPRFGFEVFLNRLLRLHNLPVAVVDWPRVASPPKASKQGLWRGTLADLRMMRDILHCQDLGELTRQIVWLTASQRARQNRQCRATAAAVSPTTSPSQMPTPSQPATKPSP